MDKKKFDQLAGERLTSGEHPTDVELASVLTDAEFIDVASARGFELSPALGSIASEGVSTAVESSVSVRTQIESMLPAAHAAYTHNVSTINDGRGRGTKLKKETLENFTDGAMNALDETTLDYMESVKETNQGETLWIPKSAANAELTQAEIINLAEVNANALGRPLWSWKERIDFLNLFTRADLSGNNPDSNSLVNHQFAPSAFNPRLYGTVAHQRKTYETLRAENPGVNVHAPALALSIGGWAIHRDTGLSLPTGYDSTYDRSVEVEAMSFDGVDFVPYSSVYLSDSVVVGSGVGVSRSGRDWVGQNLDLAA